MPLIIRLAPAQQQTFELHCGTQSRRIDGAEIEALAARDVPSTLEHILKLGRDLYQWLDGPQGWLRAGLAGGETEILLDLAAQAATPLARTLAHLPWELLHDGTAFLAERGIQLIRLIGGRATAAQPANRPLRLLFMATSPEDVEPVLDYEREEAAILDVTSRQPVDLVVEESGSVSQLRNLVASFAKDHFDVFHVTGHGLIEEGTPKFITEDELGRQQRATAEDLADAFGRRWPRLLFLSGCHTAQAPAQNGAIPSMAHAMVTAGADAVLGWARPVLDSTGIAAATELYKALATGEPLSAAVAITRRQMLREFLQNPGQLRCSDWHLLRLYLGVREAPPLVTPLKTPRREQLRHRPPEREFLDAEGKVKVAAASSFFGRRRVLQRCLRALAYPGEHHGVFLHGIGGYGKSTIAARLCRRHEAQNPGSAHVVLVGPVDEARVRQKLVDKFGANPEVVEALNRPKVEFKHQLAAFFGIIEGAGQRLLLVLDDFEQSIPRANVDDGSLRLEPGAFRALEALCFALEETAGSSRLIVTCRYHKAATLPANRLHVEGSPPCRPPTSARRRGRWWRRCRLSSATRRVS